MSSTSSSREGYASVPALVLRETACGNHRSSHSTSWGAVVNAPWSEVWADLATPPTNSSELSQAPSSFGVQAYVLPRLSSHSSSARSTAICSGWFPLHVSVAPAEHSCAMARNHEHRCCDAPVRGRVLLVVVFTEHCSAPVHRLGLVGLSASCFEAPVLRVAVCALRVQCLLSSPRAARGQVSLYLACSRSFVQLTPFSVSVVFIVQHKLDHLVDVHCELRLLTLHRLVRLVNRHLVFSGHMHGKAKWLLPANQTHIDPEPVAGLVPSPSLPGGSTSVVWTPSKSPTGKSNCCWTEIFHNTDSVAGIASTASLSSVFRCKMTLEPNRDRVAQLPQLRRKETARQQNNSCQEMGLTVTSA